MRRLVAIFALWAPLCLLAQDPPPANTVNDWAQVRKLLGGVELRVTESGKKPRKFVLGEARAEMLVVIDGNKQSAILRENVDRVELVLPNGRKRLQPTLTNNPQPTPTTQGSPHRVMKAGTQIQSQEGNTVLVYLREKPGKQ